MSPDTPTNTSNPSTAANVVSCLVNRFDHIEYATLDLASLQKLFETFGFVNTQVRESSEGTERLMVQGHIRILLTQGAPGTFAHTYATKHGDGVCSIAYHSTSAKETYETALSRGAESAMPYLSTEETGGEGKVRVGRAAIKSFGDVRATFVERSLPAFDVNALFGPGFKRTGKNPDKGVGLLVMDHLTNNVEMGRMEHWSNFYKKVYGWNEVRYFDIRAEKTGLFSKVLQSPDGATKIPVNEATEKKSQVQEFIERHGGAGVQHLALTTNDILATVKELKNRGIKFLDIMPEYYDDVKSRLANVKEPVEELRKEQILIDGDEKSYLLQIFTQDQIGPFFFEIIQRKGHNGFGEGNFKALFQSIERDQQRRGVL